jgi:hypothetical protein
MAFWNRAHSDECFFQLLIPGLTSFSLLEVDSGFDQIEDIHFGFCRDRDRSPVLPPSSFLYMLLLYESIRALLWTKKAYKEVHQQLHQLKLSVIVWCEAITRWTGRAAIELVLYQHRAQEGETKLIEQGGSGSRARFPDGKTAFSPTNWV